MNKQKRCNAVSHVRSSLMWGCLLCMSFTSVLAQQASQPHSLLMNLNATDMVPQDIRSGINYRVSDDVWSDGLVNTYQIQTVYGPLNVESTALLYKKIAELRALEQIEKLQKTDAFMDALKNAGKAPFKTAQNLIDDPLDTVKGVGSGIGRWFKDVKSSVVSVDPHQPGALETALGQAPVKRQFAYQFGVDPYSTYEPLQKALDHLAWASSGGGLTVKAAFSAVGGGAGTVLSVGGTAGGMKELVRDKSPTELNKIISQHLDTMGVRGVIRESFLANDQYGPQERVLLVGALAGMNGVADRHLFVNIAATAPSEMVALYMRVQAQMMERHAQENKVARILAADSVPFMQDEGGTAVGVFPLDYLLWTPGLAHKIDKIERDLTAANVKRKRLLFLGKVDPAAVDALDKRGWEVEEGVQTLAILKAGK